MCSESTRQGFSLAVQYTIYTYNNNVYLIGIVLVFRCSDGERMECGDVETWRRGDVGQVKGALRGAVGSSSSSRRSA